MTIINFLISEFNLEEQLLGLVVGIDNSDLERTKQDISIKIYKNKMIISEIENNILKMVSDQEDLYIILHDE